jgi:pimeloyl-[acyl-carrier protein] methyl ester esterase
VLRVSAVVDEMPFFVTPEGVKLNYSRVGHGKPLLFLHGWTMCSRVWTFQVEYFEREFQVITLDLRGHGRSASPEGDYNFFSLAQDLLNFIEGLHLEGVALIGWSLAVSLIIKLCATQPMPVSALVLVDGTPAFVAKEGFPHGLPSPVVKRMLKWLDSDYSYALKQFHNLLLSEREKEIQHKNEVWDLLTNTHYLPRQQVARSMLGSFIGEDLREELKAITVPTLLIHGGEDKICPAGASRYMSTQVKGSEMVIFPETGHVPFLTQVSRFNQSLGDFLKIL